MDNLGERMNYPCLLLTKRYKDAARKNMEWTVPILRKEVRRLYDENAELQIEINLLRRGQLRGSQTDPDYVLRQHNRLRDENVDLKRVISLLRRGSEKWTY